MSKLFPSIAMMIPELKLGDEDAWERLCNCFRPGLISRTRVYLNASRHRARLHPEDVVQETFLKAWNKRETFRGETTSQFAKWILTILRNQFVNSTRSIKTEAAFATWFEFNDKSPTPSTQLISVEREALLHACIADMNEELRNIIVLRHFEGKKFSEIAEQTHTNINTVAGLYRRGIAKLTYTMQQLKDS